MKPLTWFGVFLALIGLALGYPHTKHRAPSKEPYQTKYITQYIDHFDFLGTAGPDGQFQQRYLISGTIQHKLFNLTTKS